MKSSPELSDILLESQSLDNETVHSQVFPSLPSLKADAWEGRDSGSLAKGTTLSLVLQFDSNGNSQLIHLSRMDVLNLAHNAAKEIGESSSIPRNYTGPAQSMGGFCDVQNVHMRDLRKLDSVFAITNEPSIMVRKQAILINADPIRAIVLRNLCLVFVPQGADSLLSALMAQFKEYCQVPDIPFEFQAMEALLAAFSKTLHNDYERLSPEINPTLDRMVRVNLSSGELETLRILKNTVSEFEAQLNGVLRALTELVDNEEDLRLLHLSKFYTSPDLLNSLMSFDPEDAEVMLEVYLQEILTIKSKVGLIQHRIQNTESLVMLKLDSVRNYLLTADVLFSLVSLCMTFGMFVTGAFGMNLHSGYEGEDGRLGTAYFWGVLIATLLVCILASGAGIYYFKLKGLILS